MFRTSEAAGCGVGVKEIHAADQSNRRAVKRQRRKPVSWVSRTAPVSVGCRNSVGEARSIRLAVEAPGQNPTMEASFGGGRTPRYADVEMQVPGNNYR